MHENKNDSEEGKIIDAARSLQFAAKLIAIEVEIKLKRWKPILNEHLIQRPANGEFINK